MPMISVTGRKQLRVRMVVWMIYLSLTVGATTMVYPFLLMLAGSTKSSVDSPDATIIPKYLVDDVALYQKHIEGMFNESTALLQNAYGNFEASFRTLEPPEKADPLLGEWRAFLAEANPPSSWYTLGYFSCPTSKGSVPFNQARFRKQMLNEYGSIDAINLKFGTSFTSSISFTASSPNFLSRFTADADTDFRKAIDDFIAAQPAKWRDYFSTANQFREYLKVKYGRFVEDFNKAQGTSFGTWTDIPVGDSVKTTVPGAAKEYEEYLRFIVNPVWIRLTEEAAPAWQSYLQRRYGGDLAKFNKDNGTTHAAFEEIPLPLLIPADGTARMDWKQFVEGWLDPVNGETIQVPVGDIRLFGPGFAFQQYLKNKYGTIEALNAATGGSLASWETVQMPQKSAQYEEFLQMRGWLKWEFTQRNYSAVWDYLVVNGRGLINTVIFCALSILAALTVDPIAAYALSRFRPPSTFKVLLFLMMTMAFPAMVTQIPAFLLLRDLGMLNTFWALVLPGLANGYHIFLLKGFFDSLPQELYESAEIDGAGEPTIFLNITMSLSKPILAVMALSAFTSAYSAFMFALLLCQDPNMWTLMVWLYQLQQTSGQGIIFASLIVAAIPTFAVFVACQNVIMRGIVVPVEK